jgi:hypothetical protein
MDLLDQFFVYHPNLRKDQDWKARSGLPMENVWFIAADGKKLFGWYVVTRATSAVILWCHGNAGNIMNRLETQKEEQGSTAFRRIPVPVLMSKYIDFQEQLIETTMSH